MKQLLTTDDTHPMITIAHPEPKAHGANKASSLGDVI